MHSELHWFFAKQSLLDCRSKPQVFVALVVVTVKMVNRMATGIATSWPVVPDTEWTKQIV